MGKKKKQTETVIEQTAVEETKPTVINVNTSKFNAWKGAFILLAALWFLTGVRGCALNITHKFADWKQGIIERLIPSPPVPEPFKRERKTRPDNSDGEENDRGIIWRFLRGTSAGAKSLAAWVKENVPKDAAPKTVYDVADAFYDAADLIAKTPEIDEPSEAVAAARQGIFSAADPSWVPFLSGLDQQANTFGVESIDDVITFYYAVAGALYDAASGAPQAAAPSEAEAGDRVPPTDPGTLPPPAEPAASDAAKECPGGNCPNRSYYNGYGYGWRWY